MKKSLTFIDKVSRINKSVYEIRAYVDAVIEAVEKGEVVIEEAEVDTGTYRTVITLTTRKAGTDLFGAEVTNMITRLQKSPRSKVSHDA